MCYPDHDDAYQLRMEEMPSDLWERRKRTQRRALVNGFLKERNYWKLIRYLSEGHMPFFTIGEALKMIRLDIEFSGGLYRETLRERLVVARYFNKLGKDWLL